MRRGIRCLTGLLAAVLIGGPAAATPPPVGPTVKVGARVYRPFSAGLTNGTWVYVDADPTQASPLRVTQRSLVYATSTNTAGEVILQVASAVPWRFGVISDTQWTGSPDDGRSPHTVPGGIIRQCDEAFIAAGVRFVIAVGDTVDRGSRVNLDTRALFAQDLYNAGIGFFPIRGNHESLWTNSAAEEARLYPQLVNGGTHNLTPADVLASGYGHDRLIDSAAPTGAPFVVGGNFSYPTDVEGVNINAVYGSFSYSFDFDNARFVLIDPFENADPGGNLSSAAQQQPWIAGRLAEPGRPPHAFVFGHKNLLGGNHKDNLFGGTVTRDDPGDGAGIDTQSLAPPQRAALVAKEQAEDRFITSLADNNVRFYVSGHDHHHYDSIVRSPLSDRSVHQLICASDSSKFYIPQLPASTNDTPVSQDSFKLGYTIWTVDGPRVTVDYYGVDVAAEPSFKAVDAREAIFTNTPALTGRWRKVLTFGYSLNGREFVIPRGAAYTAVSNDTARAIANGEPGYLGTFARILGGANGSTRTNNYGKPWSKAVDTGWAPADGTASDILTLWGLAEPEANRTDTYVLSMSYRPASMSQPAVPIGAFGLLARAAPSADWVNSVALNEGGVPAFVPGPWNGACELGAWGVDTNTATAWAVVNRAGEFAVGPMAAPADVKAGRSAGP